MRRLRHHIRRTTVKRTQYIPRDNGSESVSTRRVAHLDDVTDESDRMIQQHHPNCVGCERSRGRALWKRRFYACGMRTTGNEE
jgi:hypothetical protein